MNLEGMFGVVMLVAFIAYVAYRIYENNDDRKFFDNKTPRGEDGPKFRKEK